MKKQINKTCAADLELGLLNLHDAFLNCSLIKKLMSTLPIENDPDLFPSSDRARLERLWVASLAVLVESWSSTQMIPVVAYLKKNVDTNELVKILREGRSKKITDKMIETRHYMFHRDKRKYWDPGRSGPIGNLRYNLKLHSCFSDVLLDAFKSLRPKI